MRNAISTLKEHTQYFIPVDDLPALEMAIQALGEKCKDKEYESVDIKVVAVETKEGRFQGFISCPKVSKHYADIRKRELSK